jgi:hypothetical protein
MSLGFSLYILLYVLGQIRLNNIERQQTKNIIHTLMYYRRGEEMEAAASLYYLTLFDLIHTAKYIG